MIYFIENSIDKAKNGKHHKQKFGSYVHKAIRDTITSSIQHTQQWRTIQRRKYTRDAQKRVTQPLVGLTSVKYKWRDVEYVCDSKHYYNNVFCLAARKLYIS